ncbi:Receptor-like protein kinase [Quillaja saponaria]|uniref:Receptor-like protein kinase n=1 Tax=Quillaja saponaria TaxID=32244 RepID=A0AAD7LJI5_QUISA|nr:Receptor-like protein kinase [Quillaja saponaria]
MIIVFANIIAEILLDPASFQTIPSCSLLVLGKARRRPSRNVIILRGPTDVGYAPYTGVRTVPNGAEALLRGRYIAERLHPGDYIDRRDPKRCGLLRYELTCEDDVPVLALYSGKFNVQAINYSNYTIRRADPGVSDVQIQNHTTKYCFDAPNIPRYSLSHRNFSSRALYIPYQFQYPFDSIIRIPLSSRTIFLDCSNPVRDNGLYVAEADTSCLNGRSKGYPYAIAGSDLAIEHLKVGCQVKLVTTVFWNYEDQYSNVSYVVYVNIQNWIAYGFELSWLNGVCQYYCDAAMWCSVNESTGSVQCSNYCTDFGHGFTQCGKRHLLMGPSI